MMLDLQTRLEIENKADTLLQQSGSIEYPIRLSGILTKHGLKVKIFQPEKGLDKFSEYSGMIDKKAKVIYINGEEPLYRQRFTIAHELGHWILKHQAEVDYRNNQAPYSAEELQADYFAACLLMPKNTFLNVYQKMNISQLAAFFGVSRKAIGIRAGDIFHEV